MEGTPSTSVKLNPNVSVDCVIFGFEQDQLHVLLIERNTEISNTTPSNLALPGDLIREDEDLDQAARRVLKELTGLDNIYMDQFKAFGNPNRVNTEDDRQWLESIRSQPDARVITIAYYSLIKLDEYTQPTASSFAKQVEWHPLTEVKKLAFDHNIILNTALDSLRLKLQNEPIGFELLPDKFTLSQLKRLYEVILDTPKPLDKRNFRRKILKNNYLIELNEKQTNVPHKAAKLYQFDKVAYDGIKSDKSNFIF